MRLRWKLLLGGVAVGACGVAIGFGLARTSDDSSTAVRSASPVQLTARQRSELASIRARQSGQSFLFSQNAAGGSLRGPDDQHLTLTLTGVRDWVTRFADRPARDAQTVDVRDFLARWQSRFADEPPNAVLSYRVPGSAEPRDMVLELSDPRYDAAARAASYTARRIKRTTDQLPGTKHPRATVVYPIPRNFGSASLFIDDSGSQQLLVHAGITPMSLVWRNDLSQCARNGTASIDNGFDDYLIVTYDVNSSGTCFFKRTYARFSVYIGGESSPTGTVTFGGDGQVVSCNSPLYCPATASGQIEIDDSNP